MDRYLNFEDIDVMHQFIASQCSQCGQTFDAELEPGEKMEDVLLRIHDEFDAHECRDSKRRAAS